MANEKIDEEMSLEEAIAYMENKVFDIRTEQAKSFVAMRRIRKELGSPDKTLGQIAFESFSAKGCIRYNTEPMPWSTLDRPSQEDWEYTAAEVVAAAQIVVEGADDSTRKEQKNG